MTENILKVAHIEKEEDRKLLYGKGYRLDRIRYHVIAKPDEPVDIGDVVRYEPFGVNFGWFMEVAHRAVVNKSRTKF